MPKRATPVNLNEKEGEQLVQMTKRHRSEQQHVLRARIVLAAAEGHSNAHIAQELSIHVGYRSLVARSLGRAISPHLRTYVIRSWPSLPITMARWPSLSSGPIRDSLNHGVISPPVY